MRAEAGDARCSALGATKGWASPRNSLTTRFQSARYNFDRHSGCAGYRELTVGTSELECNKSSAKTLALRSAPCLASDQAPGVAVGDKVAGILGERLEDELPLDIRDVLRHVVFHGGAVVGRR